VQEQCLSTEQSIVISKSATDCATSSEILFGSLTIFINTKIGHLVKLVAADTNHIIV